MSKRQWLIIFGLVIIVLPFLGLPSNIDTIISVAIGILIILIAYGVRPKKSLSSDSNLPYIEHKNTP